MISKNGQWASNLSTRNAIITAAVIAQRARAALVRQGLVAGSCRGSKEESNGKEDEAGHFVKAKEGWILPVSRSQQTLQSGH